MDLGSTPSYLHTFFFKIKSYSFAQSVNSNKKLKCLNLTRLRLALQLDYVPPFEDQVICNSVQSVNSNKKLKCLDWTGFRKVFQATYIFSF